MSWSVAGSNATNPLGFLQSLWPQGASAKDKQGQSDPLSSLLAALDQRNPGTNASSLATPSSGSSGTSSSNAQFGPQTLQALLALQTDNSDPQALASQVTGALNDSDSDSAQQPGATQGRHGHHHHMSAGDSGGLNPLSFLAGINGAATSQTTTNPSGTTTTSITYADGSTVSTTTTTATAGGTAGSDVTSASAGGANVTSGNLLERLIQMQAQLLAPTATQSVTA